MAIKIVKVSVAFSRTVSPRPYSPVRVDMNVMAEIGEGQDESKVRRKLYKMLKEDVDAACERILEKEGEGNDD